MASEYSDQTTPPLWERSTESRAEVPVASGHPADSLAETDWLGRALYQIVDRHADWEAERSPHRHQAAYSAPVRDFESAASCDAAIPDCPPWLTVPDPESWGFAVAGSASGPDRRVFPRRDTRGAVTVARYPETAEPTAEWFQWLLSNTGVVGELVDISRSGLAIVLVHPLQAADLMIVRLLGETPTGDVDTLAQVVRAIDVGDGRWKIVARFLDELTFDQAYQMAHRTESTGIA